MPTPRLGLGLPVYNGQRFLSSALDSVLAQDFEDWRLIICDNASDDDTQSICERYAAQDPRIIYTRNAENIGAAPNFIRAFELNESPLFKWLVYDDELEPAYLGACVAALDAASSQVVGAFPRTLLIDEAGEVLERHVDNLDLREAQPHARLRHLLRDSGYCHPNLGVLRADTLRRTRIEDSFESADIVVLAELIFLGQVQELPEHLYRRRIHADTTMSADGRMDPEALAAWLDPRNAGKRVFPRLRFVRELLASLRRAPIGRREKLRCGEVIAREYLSVHRAELAAELRAALRLPR